MRLLRKILEVGITLDGHRLTRGCLFVFIWIGMKSFQFDWTLFNLENISVLYIIQSHPDEGSFCFADSERTRSQLMCVFVPNHLNFVYLFFHKSKHICLNCCYNHYLITIAVIPSWILFFQREAAARRWKARRRNNINTVERQNRKASTKINRASTHAHCAYEAKHHPRHTSKSLKIITHC